MRRVGILITVTFAIATMFGGAALAQTIPRGALDANCPGPRDSQSFLDGRTAAQTFTAARTGKVTSAEVLINEQASTGATGDVVLKIARVDTAGRPTADVLASATIPDAELDDAVAMRAAHFEFGTAAKVVSGKQYALILRKNNDTHVNWFGRNHTSCPGDQYVRNDRTKAWENTTPNLDFVFSVYVAPNNDDFASARVVKGRDASVAGTTLGANREQGEPDHYIPSPGNPDFPDDHTVWYRWKAPAPGQSTIGTCGATIDSVLAVYTGSSLNALNRVADNNDACMSGSGSQVSFRAKKDKTYRIAMGDVGLFRENGFTLDILQGR